MCLSRRDEATGEEEFRAPFQAHMFGASTMYNTLCPDTVVQIPPLYYARRMNRTSIYKSFYANVNF